MKTEPNTNELIKKQLALIKKMSKQLAEIPKIKLYEIEFHASETDIHIFTFQTCNLPIVGEVMNLIPGIIYQKWFKEHYIKEGMFTKKQADDFQRDNVDDTDKDRPLADDLRELNGFRLKSLQ